MKPLTSFFKKSLPKASEKQTASKEIGDSEQIADNSINQAQNVSVMSYEDFLQESSCKPDQTEKLNKIKDQPDPEESSVVLDKEVSGGSKEDCVLIGATTENMEHTDDFHEEMEADDNVVICDGQSYEDFLRENEADKNHLSNSHSLKIADSPEITANCENAKVNDVTKTEFTQLKPVNTNCKKTVLDFFGRASKKEVEEKRKKERLASRRVEVKVKADVHAQPSTTFDIFDRSARKSGCESKLKLQKKSLKVNNNINKSNEVNTKVAFDATITVLDAQSSLFKVCDGNKATTDKKTEEGGESEKENVIVIQEESEMISDEVKVIAENPTVESKDEVAKSDESNDVKVEKQEKEEVDCVCEEQQPNDVDRNESRPTTTAATITSPNCFSLFQPKV